MIGGREERRYLRGSMLAAAARGKCLCVLGRFRGPKDPFEPFCQLPVVSKSPHDRHEAPGTTHSYIRVM